VRTGADEQDARVARVRLGNGTIIDLDLSDLGGTVLPVGLRCESGVIDYANGSVLSLSPLIIFAPAGTGGVISIDGEEERFIYPIDDQPLKLASGALALSTRGAMSMWFCDGGELVFGEDDFPAATGLRVTASEPPKLGDWTARERFPAISGEGDWVDIDGPTCMEQLGNYLGYGWYRCIVNSDEECDCTLYLPAAGDRILTFVNAQYVATWGKSDGASIHPMPVHLRKGRNLLVFLADNMGRPNTGRKVGELKGIWGPIGLDWQVVTPHSVTMPSGQISAELKNQWELKTCWIDYDAQCRSVIWDVDLSADESLHLSILDLPQYSYVYVNDELACYHVATGSALSDFGYEEYPLGKFVRPAANRIELRILGWESDTPPADVALYRHRTDEILRGDWSFMPFDPAQAVNGDGSGHGLRVYETEFDAPTVPTPLWLDFSSMGKGQIYLNGTALGRYWSIGPQYYLYIPEPWLQAKNRLIVFEEENKTPELMNIRQAGVTH
jgi:hypothetical protein